MSDRTAPPRTLDRLHRRMGVALVQVGDCYALIDGRLGRLWMLNQAGAHAWTQLGTGRTLDLQWHGFIAHLDREGLLQNEPDPVVALPVVDRLAEEPTILAVAPLQVAANNSLDPFAGSGW